VSLGDVLGRLEWHDGERPVSLAAEVHHALRTLTALFDGLAVIRDGRVQLILKRTPAGVRLLISDTATIHDHHTLAAGLRRSDAAIATATELLRLALALPHTPPTRLAPRLRRIVELGAELIA